MKPFIACLALGVLLLGGCGNNSSPSSPSSGTTYTYPFLSNFGENGTAGGQFTLVGGIAIFHNTLFVADAAGGGRVEKFDESGNFLSSWTGTPAFGQPFGIAIDKNGIVYVTDHINNIVEKFDFNGDPLGSFGSTGTAVGTFTGPMGIAVDSAAASIYVTETGNNRLQRCDTTGAGCVTLGGTAIGSGHGQFGYPVGVVLDGSGNIFVADADNARVQEFNSGLTFVNAFGSSGTGNGQFGLTSFGMGGLALDTDGNLLVVDSDNKRVEKFSTGGTYLQTIGAPTGGWALPRFVAVDSNKNVYVGDETGDFISKFAPN